MLHPSLPINHITPTKLATLQEQLTTGTCQLPSYLIEVSIHDLFLSNLQSYYHNL